MDKRQIKPIIPQRVLINTKRTYSDFIKKRYKVLSKLELKRGKSLSQNRTLLIHFKISLLAKIFKTLKFVRHLDLSKMTLLDRPSYSLKMKHFAKRMSNAQTIRIFDIKTERQNFKGQSELWAKHAKNAQVFGYHCRVCKNSRNFNLNLFSQSENGSIFIHLVRDQPKIKELTVEFDLNAMFLPELYFKFERYPPHLERLSFKGVAFNKPITYSMQHFRYLKRFETAFNLNCTNKFISSLLASLPCNLQSLSLHWPQYTEENPSLAFSKIKSFKCLTTLKLCFQMTISNLQQIFEPFHQCPLSDLKILVHLQSEQEFTPIANFLTNFGNLQRLQVQIKYEADLSSESPIKQLLQKIEDLPYLTRLSVSILSHARFRIFALKSNPIFSKLFTKSIPLKSLKIKLDHFIITTQDFLRFWKAFESIASTLIKLKIEIGECEPDVAESQQILDFIPNLQSIKSLKFGDLQIHRNTFLMDLAEIVENMPGLESLAVGKVDKRLKDTVFISTIERILNKRGLKKFSCKISIAFNNELKIANSKINLAALLERNPFLEKFPDLPIFDVSDYELDLW